MFITLSSVLLYYNRNIFISDFSTSIHYDYQADIVIDFTLESFPI